MPGHSRATARRKVDGGYTSRSGVVESMHTRVPPARSFFPADPVRKDLGAVRQPLPGDGKPTIQFYTGLLPFCSRRQQRAVARDRDGKSSTVPVSRAEDCPAPRSSGTRGRNQDGCLDSSERQNTAKLLHESEAAPYRGDPNDSLNRAVRPRWLISETSMTGTRLHPRRGLACLRNSKPVSAGDVRELQHLQEHLPGMVGDV